MPGLFSDRYYPVVTTIPVPITPWLTSTTAFFHGCCTLKALKKKRVGGRRKGGRLMPKVWHRQRFYKEPISQLARLPILETTH